MQFSAIVVLFSAALVAAMPAAEVTERDNVTYYTGGCSTVDQRCYLAGGSPSYPCDQQSGKCSKTNNVCTFASSNTPGSNPYATGKAHCT